MPSNRDALAEWTDGEICVRVEDSTNPNLVPQSIMFFSNALETTSHISFEETPDL